MDTVKALHIIFVVTWFAGLFYIFRLFVNIVMRIDVLLNNNYNIIYKECILKLWP